ncbi:C39 family peptidase (plasmid) [Nicoliella spurrieriana]|uniref:C39 family peptidase n=2 Tax=Nicoliella spurrieriana TaxID=2925830 RepID=A0A976RQS1_9LACO|nr:C39 family peptidase [Nicoliella spurrieriana]
MITLGMILFTVFAASNTIVGESSNQLPGTFVDRPASNGGTAVQLDAPFISQQAIKAWNGCEAASLLEGLHEKGVMLNTDLRTFLAQMPISKNNDPNNGYAGSPYLKSEGRIFQSIFPEALTKWGNQYHHVKNISGSSVSELRAQVKLGNPVVTYIVSHYGTPQYQKYFWGTGINNSHVVLLDGYENGYYHVADPNRGKYWVNADLFERAYNYQKDAVAIQ